MLLSGHSDFEIPFPLELIFYQTPASFQGSGIGKGKWMETVREAARNWIGQRCKQPFLDDRPLMVTIYYFPPTKMKGDIDNIVKPILDAMVGIVYLDDTVIERVIVQKFEPEYEWIFESPTPDLARAIGMERPTVYIRLDDDQTWRTQPWPAPQRPLP